MICGLVKCPDGSVVNSRLWRASAIAHVACGAMLD